MTVEVTRLENGLTVASDSMPGLDSVSLGIWVKAGARHEAAAINGIAHLLEHMAFKGTERRSAYQIAAEIEAVGGYLNAYTGRESTAFYAKVLSADLPLALDILADILQHPTLDAEELARERGVVLQEIGQARDTPDDIIFDHFQATAFPNQAVGRSVLGEANTVQRLGREDILGFLDSNYGPERMVLAAAGDVSHADLRRLAERSFVALTADDGSAPEAADYRGGYFSEERDLEQVHLLVGAAAPGFLSENYYGVGLLSTLLGGGMSSRLFQEVREKRGLAYSIYSFNAAMIDGGLFGFYAGTGAKDLDALTEVLSSEVKRLPGSLTGEEVERARAQVRASYLMSREGTTTRCEQLAQQVLTYGRPLAPADVLSRIDAVKEEDIRTLCDTIFTSAPTVAVLGPHRGRVEVALA